jgi:hypothetical protein
MPAGSGRSRVGLSLRGVQTFGPVPFAVAVGWTIILYSAMAFADTFALPAWADPALVGLLGLNIDLIMDAVAIRLPLWQWLSSALNEQWFGVPYVNFYAWFVVLCSFSALLWKGRPLPAKPGWQGPLDAISLRDFDACRFCGDESDGSASAWNTSSRQFHAYRHRRDAGRAKEG